ncbi:uncharacterized protein [Cebidichthys violaceus]|uniref:uncharacterized protein isoform X1 n=1 Tax=Cebidichthys violaceus TaxID=271503 RepID=UPI0035C9EA1F
MAGAGLCCASLEEPKTLMKMGLSMILVGHVNFLLGALMHGVVLRHINLHKQARAMEYAISNVVALTSGLAGIVVGILAIVLSKNKKSRGLMWSLFTVGLAAALTAAASATGLSVSVVRAAVHGGRSLLTHCSFPDAAGYSSITDECPFDPTRIYSTTLILWVPLIVTCVIQTVFSARCFAVCVSFLGLPCCPNNKRTRDSGRPINVVRPMKEAAPSHYPEPPRSCPESPRSHREPPRSHREPPRSYPEPPRSHREPPRSYTEPPTCYSEPPRSYTEPPTCYSEPPRSYTEPPRSYSEPPGSYTEPPRSYTEPPRSYTEPPRSYSEPPGSYTEPPTRYSDPRSHRKPPRQNTEPPRQQRRPPPPPQHPPHQHRSPPPSERRPLRQPKRERSDGGRQETRVGSQQRAAEKHQLLERATLERSSFWI